MCKNRILHPQFRLHQPRGMNGICCPQRHGMKLPKDRPGLKYRLSCNLATMGMVQRSIARTVDYPFPYWRLQALPEHLHFHREPAQMQSLEGRKQSTWPVLLEQAWPLRLVLGTRRELNLLARLDLQLFQPRLALSSYRERTPSEPKVMREIMPDLLRRFSVHFVLKRTIPCR